MARLSVIVTVLFFLITVSQARSPSNLLEDDVIDGQLPHSLSRSDVSSVLRLPSDSSVNDQSQSTESAGDLPQSESISVRSIPLRFVPFRPINRHFPIRSRFPFRNCRHHHHHNNHDRPFFVPIRQQNQQRDRMEIPYGNDMILSTDENNEFDPLMFHHGRMQRIPDRWVKFPADHHHHHHHHDDDGFSNFFLKHSRRFGDGKLKKHLQDDHEKEEENEETRKKGVKGGFVNRIRKFLDHF